MLRKALLSTCLAFGCCATCFGQVTLEHKLNEGNSHTAETTVKTDQKLTINGTDIDTSANTQTTAKSTVGKRDVEGKLRVDEKVETLKLSMTVMGMTYDFDSANPDNKSESQLEILRPVHKALVGRTTTTVYDKFNRVSDVESDPSIVNALPAEVQNLVKGQLDSATLKSAANDELDQVKSDPIKQGDTWQRASSANFGGGQVMSFKTEFTYAGPIEKDGRTLDKITSKTLEVTFALENSPLPLSIKTSDLKPAESEGVILFDRKLGQIVEIHSTVRITGDITFTINDMNLPSKLDLKMERTTVVKP